MKQGGEILAGGWPLQFMKQGGEILVRRRSRGRGGGGIIME